MHSGIFESFFELFHGDLVVAADVDAAEESYINHFVESKITPVTMRAMARYSTGVMVSLRNISPRRVPTKIDPPTIIGIPIEALTPLENM